MSGSSGGARADGRRWAEAHRTDAGAADRAVSMTQGSAPAMGFLRAYVQHKAARATEAALVAASNACHAAADWPPAHYAYGEAWLAVGQPGRARQAFGAALRLAPAWAEAWVNFGVAAYRLGDLDGAKAAMRQALRLVPGHAAAAANLGAFLRISGEAEAGESLLRGAVAAGAGNEAARLNLAAELLAEERAGEALALLESGPMPPGADARLHWQLQRALGLLQQRRLEEARALLAQMAQSGPIPPHLAPLWHWRQVLLATAEGDLASACRSAGLMEGSLAEMGPEAVPEHRIMGHYDLAKFWSGQAADPVARRRAFANWQAGHDLLRAVQPFSRAAHTAFQQANIAAFPRARFAAAACVRDAAPVFIVGMPRSGTTLCEQILAAHPRAHGAGERTALGRSFLRLGGAGLSAESVARIAGLDAATLAQEAGAYLAELHALAPGAERIIDKMPGNLQFLGLAGLMLPEAKIIHCVRDPRDIGLSIFTFRFHGSHGYAHDLGDLGWMIAQSDALMRHWKAALPNRILTVRLNDWVEDFDATLARVLTHVGLPHSDACRHFHAAESRVRTVSRAQVRQKVNGRGIGRWKRYAEELAPLVAELGDALEGW